MLAASKLLSNKGENSCYHLNESQLLEKWMQDNGHVMIALFWTSIVDGSGLFLTCRERLRREITRKKVWYAYNLHYTDNQDKIMNMLHFTNSELFLWQAAHELPFTPSEAKLFLLKEPLLGCDNLGEDEERYLFKACRKVFQNTTSSHFILYSSFFVHTFILCLHFHLYRLPGLILPT